MFIRLTFEMSLFPLANLFNQSKATTTWPQNTIKRTGVFTQVRIKPDFHLHFLPIADAIFR